MKLNNKDIKTIEDESNVLVETNFKRLILKKGLTYADVAKLVGVSEVSILRYANGERNPTWEIGKRIGEVFGVSGNHLLNLFNVIE